MFIQIYFWNYIFQKLNNYTSVFNETHDSDLTILICAKNEADNLKRCIPELLQQSLITEILIVDDFSSDKTQSILSAYANEHPRIKSIHASQDIKGKKQALMDGLAHIKTKWVLLTDADCIPATNQWISKMLSNAQLNDLVLGFSPYIKTSGFLNRWIRYEAVLTAIQYFSYSLIGKTYMGVGRNLLYKKSAIGNGEELLSKLELQSGDDDLLVNAIATKENVGIQLDPASWVYSYGKTSWSAYINQKRRHHTTATSYKANHQLLLGLFSISWIFLYVVIVYLLFVGSYNLALALLIFRWISTYMSVFKLFTMLDLKESISHWWYLDVCTAIYFLFFSIFVILPKKEAW